MCLAAVLEPRTVCTSYCCNSILQNLSILSLDSVSSSTIVYDFIDGVCSGKPGKELGPRATGKSTLYFESISAEDIDTYQCVIEGCIPDDIVTYNVDISVPETMCTGIFGTGIYVYM